MEPYLLWTELISCERNRLGSSGKTVRSDLDAARDSFQNVRESNVLDQGTDASTSLLAWRQE